ncbi:MAG: glycosyltransferase [Bacteroidota bacterium]
MIPKLLHYVWLSGDPLPELIQKCRLSWEKWLPDYEWILWDRKKIEGIGNNWLAQALETSNYAFATDFIRIYALYNFGGNYLDADVEVTGSLDPFLKHKFFIGFEFNDDLEPAVFGSVAGHPLLKDLLDYYRQRDFIKENKQYDRRPLPLIFNETASQFGFRPNGQLQSLKEGIQVFPCEYFSPKNLYFKNFKTTGKNVAIHHLVSSWVKKGWKHKSIILFHQLIYMIGGKWLHSRVVAIIRNF